MSDNKGQTPKLKEYTLTSEEMAEYGFFSRLQKERQMEAQFWAIQVDGIRQNILHRCGFNDLKEIRPDWGQVFDQGKVFVTKREELKQPIVTVGPEEKKPI